MAEVIHLQNYTLRSSANFWLPLISQGHCTFPLKLYSSDWNHIALDAVHLSAVSPLMQRVFGDTSIAAQFAWNSESISLIFADTSIQTLQNFVYFITSGNCQFQSNEDMEQVKMLIKCLAVKYPPIYGSGVECNVEVKEEKYEPTVNDLDHNMDDLLDDGTDAQDLTRSVNTNGVDGEQKPGDITKLDKPKNHVCEYCKGVIGAEEDSWSYMLHMSSHIGPKAFECTHCKFVLRNQNDWKNHMGGETGEKRRKVCCGLCGEVFVGQWNYLVHKSDAHENGKPITCETCNAVMTDPNVWRHHQTDHVRVVCQICGVSITKNALKKHMKIQHLFNPKTDIKPCRVCGKEFMHEFNRQQHEKNVHTAEKTKVCDICGKGFKTASSLKNHVEAVHRNNSKWKLLEKVHACRMCGKAFKRLTELAKHEKRHNANGFFKCDSCEKHFASEERLKAHKRDYHSKVKHECLVCGKKFCSLSQAKMHCLNHNTAKIRSYQCELCLQWFENKDYGATHIKNFHMNEPVKPTIRHRTTDEFMQLMRACIRDIPDA